MNLTKQPPTLSTCPFHSGSSMGGESRGLFDAMDKNQIIESLASIITTQADMEALQSLIEERKRFLEYQRMTWDFHYGIKAQKEGVEP